MSKNDNLSINLEDISKRLATNLNKLKSAMDWNQSEFADKWGVSTGALNNYLKLKDGRIPSLDLLVKLCRIEDFQKAGFIFTIDDLLSDSFNPVSDENLMAAGSSSNADGINYDDFIGNYLCYFNEQADLTTNSKNIHERHLRYGVLSIFDEVNSISGKRSLKAMASFYKFEDKNDANDLKKSLDEIYKNNSRGGSCNITKRNDEIIKEISKGRKFYTGELTFGGQKAFIDISSTIYADKALIILYAPPKSAAKTYIGGIGSVTSVSHGEKHMPTAQKIIISKVAFNCSEQDVMFHLHMSYPDFSKITNAQEIAGLCDKLYNKEYSYLNPADKISVIQNRVNKTIKDYIKDNLCCASTVSEDEDRAVYNFISDYLSTENQ